MALDPADYEAKARARRDDGVLGDRQKAMQAKQEARKMDQAREAP